jgi:hypothetical protein
MHSARCLERYPAHRPAGEIARQPAMAGWRIGHRKALLPAGIIDTNIKPGFTDVNPGVSYTIIG